MENKKDVKQAGAKLYENYDRMASVDTVDFNRQPFTENRQAFTENTRFVYRFS